MNFSPYIQSYMETALWASYDNNDEPFDNYDIGDFSPETLKKIITDCNSFEDLVTAKFPEMEFDWAQMAHDFWLTRNRHGAGFWDGDYEKGLGEALTEIAHTFGETYLYIGDDGKIYSD